MNILAGNRYYEGMKTTFLNERSLDMINDQVAKNRMEDGRNDRDMREEYNRRMDFDRRHERERRDEFDRRHDFDLRFPFWWLIFFR